MEYAGPVDRRMGDGNRPPGLGLTHSDGHGAPCPYELFLVPVLLLSGGAGEGGGYAQGDEHAAGNVALGAHPAGVAA
jgi:hypothetical protein